MGDLTKEDQARKEAGDKYFKADSRESLDLAIAGNDWNAGWQAACTYKQKRITELEELIMEAAQFVGTFQLEDNEPLDDFYTRLKSIKEGGGDD